MKKDSQMAAANDKSEVEIPSKDDTKNTVGAVMDGIKETAKKAKKLPAIIETDEHRTVSVRYKFNETERKDIGQRLAQRHIELVELAEEKKVVMSGFTERLKAKTSDINKLSRQLRDGYDNRDHQCTLSMNFKKKEKAYRDIVSKKIVKAEPFSPGDEQRRFL